MVDAGTPSAFDLADALGLPLVVNAPTLPFTLDVHLWGQGRAGDPAWGTGYGRRMTLAERCANLLFPRAVSAALMPEFIAANSQRKARGLPALASQREMFAPKAALMLVNTAFGLEYPRALPPSVRMVGPLLPASVEPLAATADLQSSPPRIPRVLDRWLAAPMMSDPILSEAQSGGEPHKTSSARRQSPKRNQDLGVLLVNLGQEISLDRGLIKVLVKALCPATPGVPSPFKVLWLVSKDTREAIYEVASGCSETATGSRKASMGGDPESSGVLRSKVPLLAGAQDLAAGRPSRAPFSSWPNSADRVGPYDEDEAGCRKLFGVSQLWGVCLWDTPSEVLLGKAHAKKNPASEREDGPAHLAPRTASAFHHSHGDLFSFPAAGAATAAAVELPKGSDLVQFSADDSSAKSPNGLGLPLELPPHFQVKVLKGGVPHLELLKHERVRAVLTSCRM